MLDYQVFEGTPSFEVEMIKDDIVPIAYRTRSAMRARLKVN